MSGNKFEFHLTIVRHGETEENVQGIIQGWMESTLNDVGREQAKCLAKSKHFNIDCYNRIYSSDLKRAYETCLILVNETNKPILTDQLLRERSFGQLQGHSIRDLVELAKQSGVSVEKYVAPDGESLQDVNRRVRTFIEERILTTVSDGDHILIVSHGGLIRQIIHYLCQFDNCAQSYQMKANRIPPNTSLNQFKVIVEEQQTKRSIMNVHCIQLHSIHHLSHHIQQQACNQLQINANVDC